MKTNITILAILLLGLASCGSTEVNLPEKKASVIPSQTNNQLACQSNLGNSVQVELPQNPGSTIYRSPSLYLCDGRELYATIEHRGEWDNHFQCYLDGVLIGTGYNDLALDRDLVHPYRPQTLLEIQNPKGSSGAILNCAAIMYKEHDPNNQGRDWKQDYRTQTIPPQDCGCF